MEAGGSMAGYTKLMSSIVKSSIWDEDDATVRVWIGLLALSDAVGFIEGSPTGIARIVNVPMDKFAEAIRKFTSPDPMSKTKDFDGRRIEVMDSGYKIINYIKYREMYQHKGKTPAERQKEYRERKAAQIQPQDEEKPKPKAKPKKGSMSLDFSPEIVDMVNAIGDICPEHQPQDKNLKIRMDAGLTATRIEAIISTDPQVKDYLVPAWTEYLTQQIKPKAWKAPQYFFGKAEDNGDGANWKPWARIAYRKAQHGRED